MTSQVSLRWTPYPGAESYCVYRLWGSFLPLKIAEGVTQPFFQDSQLEDSTEYSYAISAVVAGREGPLSGVVPITTLPGLVQGVTASLEGAGVRVRWNLQQGVRSYLVFRESGAALVAPARFLVEGSPIPNQFFDPAPPTGVTLRYFVQPVSPITAYAYGKSSFATVNVPGQPGVVHDPIVTAAVPTAPILRAEGRVGGVQLSWTEQGSNVVYQVTRKTPNQPPMTVGDGLLTTSFWDRTAPPGVPVSYQVTVQAVTNPMVPGLVSPSVSAVAGSSPPRPDAADLSLEVADQPVQKAFLRAADRSRPFRGVLILLGGSTESLPELCQAANDSQWAILSFGEFNFGTPQSPRTLTTKLDRSHGLLVLDLHRPEMSSRYLHLALQAAAKAWPEHPELETVPLAGWAFSQAGVSLVQVLSRPEWAPRVAALVHAKVLELEVTIPLFPLAHVPQLFLLSGRADPYSQLRLPMAYAPEIPREVYLRNLFRLHGFPVTIVSLVGKNHVEGLDPTYARDWLTQVLAQVDTSPVPSLRMRRGWVGQFQTELTTKTPWGDGSQTGVQVTETKVGLELGDGPNWSWFPDRRAAELWMKTVD